MTPPRLAVILTTFAVAAGCWQLFGADRGDEIGRALRSGQWQLAQQRIDAHRRQHGRSTELSRWQTALDLAARGPEVAQEGQAPVEEAPAPSIDLPFESSAVAGAGGSATAVGDAPDSVSRSGGVTEHRFDAPATLVTR